MQNFTRLAFCAALSIAPITVSAIASPALAEQAAHQKSDAPYAKEIHKAARRFDVPGVWIRAVIDVESDGNPLAVSPKGAQGLMQIMPGTWRELRHRHDLGAKVFNPGDNILAGTAYISELHRRFGSPGWIAAYHAGPGRYRDYLSGRKLPRETRAYVAKISARISGLKASSNDLDQSFDWKRSPLFVPRPKPAEATDPKHNPDMKRDTRTAIKPDANPDSKPANKAPEADVIAEQSASLFAVSSQRSQKDEQ